MQPWRQELASVGVDDIWKSAHGEKAFWGTVNVYVKMRELGLWQFVVKAVEVNQAGNLHFLCAGVQAFQGQLAELGFTEPEYKDEYWHSREPVERLSLHIKHFPGWPGSQLQAHIDPVGMVETSLIDRIRTGVKHLAGYHGYKNVDLIRTMLAKDGLKP